MAKASSIEANIKPTDLRGILKYVPQFRDHVFVIAIDASIVNHENFANVVTDIAVLRSLNIKLVLVHGIGHQIKQIAKKRRKTISDAHGSGATDETTLDLAVEASGIVSHKLVQALTQNNLACAVTNAIKSTPMGMIKGEDYMNTGKVDKIDLTVIAHLLSKDIIPLLSPITFDREGNALRVNSDLLASKLAVALEASKLIYLTPNDGLIINDEVLINIPVESLEKVIEKEIESIDPRVRSKALYSAETLRQGTQRAHILDGRVFGGLLIEIFDKVGLGTMIHANEYQQIRQARKRDVQTIFDITNNAAQTETLRNRSKQSIEKNIQNFYVYEIDKSIIGCISISPIPKTKKAEMGSVLVQPFYQGRGVGKKLVEFAVHEAKRLKYQKLIALSTQSFEFFEKVCGFSEGTIKDLSAERKKEYEASGRGSKILIKAL